MPSPQIERKLAAIMFTDIAGYTALSAKDSTKSSELLKTQRDTLKPIVEKHGGSWMKEIGDGLLLTFDSATSAVECSIAIQETTKDIEDLNLRIGIHEGEVIKQDGDVIGDDVNVASRIEPFSTVGGVAITHKIQQAISSNKEFETKYVGKPKLKGVSQEVKVYCITSHGLPETDVSKVSAKLEEESKFNIFALTGGILTAIGIAFWIAVGVFDVSFGGKAEVPSVGILMMENLGKEDEEFWSSGMTADLITKVAGAGLIRVAPLKEIRNIDSNLSIEEIAKKLRVKYILTHSFLIKTEGFDLWCKLENIETGVALFSNKISEPIDMTTQMVGKLANDIVTSLKVKTKQDMMKTPTANAEAYEFYLKAKYIHEKRESMQDTEIAQGLLYKAIDLDDNLISARHLLGETYQNNNYDKAEEIYLSSLAKSEELNDKLWIGRSIRKIGVVYKHKGNNDKALDYYKRALVIAGELDDKSGIAASLYNIGNVYVIKSDYDKALDYNNRSLALDEEVGDKLWVGRGLRKIGNIYYNKGDKDKALDYYERAVAIAEELDDKSGIAASLRKFGMVYAEKGVYDKALDCFSRSSEISDSLGQKRFVGNDLYQIAIIYSYKGDDNMALDYLGRALAIAEEVGYKNLIKNCIGSIGSIYFDKGNYNTAEEYLEKSLTNHIESGLVADDLIWFVTYLYLTYRNLGKSYDVNEIHSLIKEAESIEYDLNLLLFQLLEDTSYLETAYKQVQEKASAMEEELAKKFLRYPFPKKIVEEWEKVK